MDLLRRPHARAGDEARRSPPPRIPRSLASGEEGEKIPAALDSVDVVFPVLHGPYGEDGTIQGLLELAGIPYVGSGVLASAVGMDKLTMKKIFATTASRRSSGSASPAKMGSDGNGWVRRVEAALGYPCFVKPANLGSSVGIGKATDAGELERALGEAAALDRRLIVEAGVDAGDRGLGSRQREGRSLRAR